MSYLFPKNVQSRAKLDFVQFSQEQAAYASRERVEQGNKTTSGFVGDVGKVKLPHTCLFTTVKTSRNVAVRL